MNPVLTLMIILIYTLVLLISIHGNNPTKCIIEQPKFKRKSQICAIESNKLEIERYIKNNIEAQTKDSNLRDMLSYALGDGKRIRPIIILSTFRIINNVKELPEYIILIALAIEYFHCASLVVDDIMDEDLIRRGKQSVYAKYGLANAQMIGMILSTFAMKNISLSLSQLTSSVDKINPEIYTLVLSELTNYANELSLGQFFDISKSQSLNVESLIQLKTSTLFEYCYIMPWVYSNTDKPIKYIEEGIVKMKEIAKYFGLIFQIADDFEDVQQDLSRGSKNYVIENGYDKGYNDYKQFVEEFQRLTLELGIKSVESDEMIEYLSEGVEYYSRLNDKK